MIVIANEEFATGLRLAGVKNSHIIRTKQQAEDILKDTAKDEFIIATQKVTEMSSKFGEYPNVIIFPDTLKDFSKIDDLKTTIKTAIGSEVEI
jgi:vacuolar-type H+-ATPase subunit F/Vma7